MVDEKDGQPSSDFSEDSGAPRASLQGELRLDLEGYEGPIHVLLELAREQKVDILQISMLRLAEQYLEFIRRAQSLNLELAADYLVMAAWLAYLKSRLLLPLPKDDGEEPSATAMAAALRFQLQRLEAMQEAGKRLFERPRLGQEIFTRGAPEPLEVVRQIQYEVTLFELLQAYSRHHVRVKATSLDIQPFDLYSVEEAMQRLNRFLGNLPDWRSLNAFLPSDIRDNLLLRSAVASTFAASLELVKAGKVEIRQDGSFGPLFIRSKHDTQ